MNKGIMALNRGIFNEMNGLAGLFLSRRCSDMFHITASLKCSPASYLRGFYDYCDNVVIISLQNIVIYKIFSRFNPYRCGPVWIQTAFYPNINSITNIKTNKYEDRTGKF